MSKIETLLNTFSKIKTLFLFHLVNLISLGQVSLNNACQGRRNMGAERALDPPRFWEPSTGIEAELISHGVQF